MTPGQPTASNVPRPPLLHATNLLISGVWDNESEPGFTGFGISLGYLGYLGAYGSGYQGFRV